MFDTLDSEISIPFDQFQLSGLLHIPKQAIGAVIFAHGSGSSRFSTRNQFVAKILQQSHFATLLFDLLTAEEDVIDENTREYRFNIKLLAERLLVATKWTKSKPELAELPIGFFGASTGGSAALVAAGKEPTLVKAIVSRGGRPDLAGANLAQVRAATLLIVGGEDKMVIELNDLAYQQLNCVKEMTIVPGATHLFEEPGKLEKVSRLADDWFKKYLMNG